MGRRSEALGGGLPSSSSGGMAAEEVEELDEEDQDDGDFKEKGAALVELLDHVVVELLGGTELLGDEIFIVRDADLGGGQLVEARRIHVAQELDGVVGMLGELGDIEKDGVETVRRARQTPARQSPGLVAEGIVDTVENAGEEFIVVAELKELGVGVFEELDGGLGAGAPKEGFPGQG
jgi:hypothetical protein